MEDYNYKVIKLDENKEVKVCKAKDCFINFFMFKRMKK